MVQKYNLMNNRSITDLGGGGLAQTFLQTSQKLFFTFIFNFRLVRKKEAMTAF